MHTAQTENSKEYPRPEKGGVVKIRLHMALKFVYNTLEPQKLVAVGVLYVSGDIVISIFLLKKPKTHCLLY